MSFWIKKLVITPNDAGLPTVTIDSLHLDSTHDPETAQEEDSRGLEVYLGTDDVYNITHYDEGNDNALRSIMLAEDIVDVTFTDAQGNNTTVTGFSVIAWKNDTFQPRDKIDYRLRLKRTFL